MSTSKRLQKSHSSPFPFLYTAPLWAGWSAGNVLILLNAASSLGPKGTVLEVPKDKIIYQELRHRGEWEKEVSKFLSECLRDLKKEQQDIFNVLEELQRTSPNKKGAEEITKIANFQYQLKYMQILYILVKKTVSLKQPGLHRLHEMQIYHLIK
jgi:hypothetical protein